MPLFRRLAALAGATEAARRYARKNPDKAGKYLDQAAAFVDKQTKGKYSNQIRDAASKAKGVAGIPQSGQPGHDQQGYGNGQTRGYDQNPGYGQNPGHGQQTPPTPPPPSRPTPPPNSPRL